MTQVEIYAHHASNSYGQISPEQFAEIIKGSASETEEGECLPKPHRVAYQFDKLEKTRMT